MTIGGSIALIVIGAILRFGITWKPAHVRDPAQARSRGHAARDGGALGDRLPFGMQTVVEQAGHGQARAGPDQ